MSKRLLFVLFLLITCVTIHVAQTKPKAQVKSKTQTKPKTTSKAPVKKKAAPKEVNVYVCTSGDRDKCYHKRNSCAGLNKCSGEIKNIKTSTELGKYKRQKCARCFGK